MDVRTKDLRGAVGAVKKAVSSRPGIPALTGVLLEAGDGRMRATSTDLEVSVRAAVDGVATIEGERWAMLVPFRMLADAARAATGERFTIEPADGDGKAVRVNGGGLLRLLPVEDFPTLAVPEQHVATIPADAVRAVLGAVLPAVSRDPARPIQTGVFLELEASGAVLATSTDSYRLHHAETAGAVVDGKAIVPGRALEALVKILGRKTAGAVAMYEDEHAVRFVLPGGLELTVRSIEGEFPNYRQLMPERGPDDGVLRYSVDDLAAVLKQAAPYCRDTCPVRLELNGEVTMTASAPDLGAFRAVVPGATYEGPELVVAYNPVYLLDAIGAAGPEVRVRDGLKPALIGTRKDPYGRVALVMPVRLPSDVGAHYPAPVATAEPEPEEEPEPVDDGEPEPVEHEPDPDEWARCAHGHVRGERCPECEPAEPVGHEEPVDVPEGEPEPDDIDVPVPAAEPTVEVSSGAEPWAELATLGDVDGVRVRLVTGPDGEPRVDLRRFVDGKRYQGPTRKGFAIRASSAGVLAELLLDAAAASEA